MLEQILLWPGDVPKESVDSISSMYSGLLENEPFAPDAKTIKNHFLSLVHPVANPESKSFLLSLVNFEGLIGFAMGSLVFDTADIDYIWVCSIYRRTGKAKLILQILSEQLNKKGVKRILLEVSEFNQNAHALYAGLGFEKINMRLNYYKDGSTALVMRKELNL